MTESRNRQKPTSRMRLRAALPAALLQALGSYRALAFGAAPAEARAFQQHQAACKAALQHIEALLKLADATGAEPVTETAADGADATGALIARAEAAYAVFATSDTGDDDAVS